MILVVHEFPFIPIFQPTMNLGGESSSIGNRLGISWSSVHRLICQCHVSEEKR